jgi:Domain of unknown function (DUF4234)
MAETIMIEGRPYLKRNPLGVLGLSFVTLGIYFFYWYWKVNDELSTFEHDDSISPTRSLVAITLGWVIFVPPFIAIYNTAKHVQGDERRLGTQPELEPALTIALLVLVSIVNGVYIQDHLNRVWERSVGSAPARPDGSAG